MAQMEFTPTCIWYADEATYLRFKEICDDKGQFVLPYSVWIDRASKVIMDVASSGHFVSKVMADPDEFLKWCRVNSRRPNAEARSAFAVCKDAQARLSPNN